MSSRRWALVCDRQGVVHKRLVVVALEHPSRVHADDGAACAEWNPSAQSIGETARVI